MGAILSTSENPNTQNPPSEPTPPISLSPPNMTSIPQNPDPKSPEIQNPDPKSPENPNPETSNQPINPNEKGQINDEVKQKEQIVEDEEEEEEEEGECGFCLFMKGGGCKDEFVAWEVCVEESEKNQEDIVEKCFEVTANLKKCMEAHSEYYEPILRAEKAAEEEVKQELEREAEAEKSGPKTVEENAEIQVQN